MPDQNIKLLTSGEQGLVVEFGNAIDPALNDRVHAFCRRLTSRKTHGIIEIIPTYRSALIIFDPLTIARDELKKTITPLLDETATQSIASPPRVIRIPVCYGGEFGPDLAFVASHNKLTEADVIRIHTSRPYKIYMLGFMPGFPYLGGMDERIAAPRLPKPRTKIPAGSVGIAGNQTGFYPYESPGGWRLIGRASIKPFNPTSPEPFLFSAGDLLQFYSVSAEEFEDAS